MTELFQGDLGQVLPATASPCLIHFTCLLGKSSCEENGLSKMAGERACACVLHQPVSATFCVLRLFTWAKLEPETDRFVLHTGSAVVSCAVVDWEQNMSANMWLCVIWQPGGREATL